MSDQAAVASALAESVADVGRLATTDPSRVRALLSDSLGAQARPRRAEIDALVIAVEEGVPTALLGRQRGTGGEPDAELLARLESRGLDASMSQFALGAWGAALAAETSVPNPLTDPVTTGPLLAAVTAGQLISEPKLETLPESRVSSSWGPPSLATAVTQFTPPPTAPTTDSDGTAPRPTRRGLLIGVAAVAAIALVAGGAHAVTQSGSEPSAVSALSAASPSPGGSSSPSSTTSAVASPSTPPAPAPSTPTPAPVATATVPDLTSMTVASAASALERRGLKLGSVSRGHSGRGAGQVFSQSVATGAHVKRGTRVNVTADDGTVQVPSVVGMSAAAAAGKLTRAGFTPSVVRSTGGSQPVGFVKSQSPSGGWRAPGSVVRINVVSSSDPVPVY